MTKKDEKAVLELTEGDKNYEKEARVIVALFSKGVDKEKVQKYAGVKRGFHKIWNNLKKNHYFSDDGKIVIGTEEDLTDVEFYLMILCAKGYIERRIETT